MAVLADTVTEGEVWRPLVAEVSVVTVASAAIAPGRSFVLPWGGTVQYSAPPGRCMVLQKVPCKAAKNQIMKEQGTSREEGIVG